jgi:hypothetical protein
MVEGLLSAGLLMVLVGLSNKTPERDNTNTLYCVGLNTHSNPKNERIVTSSSSCSKGTTKTELSKQTLSERKSK